MVFDIINRHPMHQNASLRLSIVSFFIAFAFASFESVWGLYLFKIFGSESAVGFVSGCLSIIGFFGYVFLVPVIQKFHEKSVWIFASVGFVVSYLLFAYVNNPILVVFVAALYYGLRGLNDLTRGLMISNSCSKSMLGKVAGMCTAIRNIGYIIAPITVGYLMVASGIKAVFLLSPVFIVIGTIIMSTVKIREVKDNSRVKFKKCMKNIKEFFSHKEGRNLYILSGGVPFYWSIMYIYTPIYIVTKGYPESYAGIFLFAVAIPLVIAEYPAGRFSDKYGFKKIFKLGFLIMGVCSLLGFFLSEYMVVSLACLIFGSIGVGIIDSNRESYFFKTVTETQKEKFFGPFRTHREVFRIIPKVLAGIMFSILSLTAIGSGRIEFVYLFVGVFMFVFYLLAERLIPDGK